MAMPAILTHLSRWFRPDPGQLAAHKDWFDSISTRPAATRPEAAAPVSIASISRFPSSAVEAPVPADLTASLFKPTRPAPAATSNLHPDDNWFEDDQPPAPPLPADEGESAAVAGDEPSDEGDSSPSMSSLAPAAAPRTQPAIEATQPQDAISGDNVNVGADPEAAAEALPSEAPDVVDQEEWAEPGDDGFADAPASPVNDPVSPTDGFWDDDLELAPDEEDLPFAPVDTVERERCLRRAGQRAAALALRLDLPTPSAQRSAVRRLTELLKTFPHGATHAAIGRVVEGGISLEHLEVAVEIIQRWRRDSSLWLIRRFDRLERRWTVRRHAGARHALRWADAARLAAVADGLEEAEYLLSEWHDEWARLSPGADQWWTLADFVRARLALHQVSLAGSYDPCDGDDDDRWDGYRWHHRLSPEFAGSVAPDGRLAYHAPGH